MGYTNHDVIIVGAGVSGTATLIETVQQSITKNQKISIAIIEERSVAGPGLPFNPAQDKTLRFNSPAYGVGFGDSMNFVQWLYDNPAEGYAYDITVVKNDQGQLEINDRFPPRALYGKYCAATLQATIAKAKAHGIDVTLMTNTTVKAMDKTNENRWELTVVNKATQEESKLVGRYGVLALGHLPTNQFPHLKNNSNYYESPWGDLSKIDTNKSVAIVGSSSSAIDTDKLLAAQGHKGQRYFVSPSGVLPVVRNPQPATPQVYSLKHLTPQALNAIDNLKMDDVIELFCQELNYCLHRTDITVDNLQAMLKGIYQQDPLSRLENEIGIVESGNFRHWIIMLDEVWYQIFPLLTQKLDEEGLIDFFENYYGIYSKYSVCTPLPNAKFLLDEIKSGALKLVSNFKQAIASDSGFHVEYKSETIAVDYLINAAGPTGKNIDNHPLLKYMREHDYVSQHFYNGIAIDLKTYRVQDKDKNPQFNLFALGPCTFGCTPHAYDVAVSMMYGKQIATSMVNSFEKQVKQGNYSPAFFQRPKYDSENPYADMKPAAPLEL